MIGGGKDSDDGDSDYRCGDAARMDDILIEFHYRKNIHLYRIIVNKRSNAN